MAGFEAVAAVVCDLVSAGALRTIAMPAAADEVESCCVLHREVWLNARRALLAGFDRSILTVGGGGWRERSRGKKRTMGASNGF